MSGGKGRWREGEGWREGGVEEERWREGVGEKEGYRKYVVGGTGGIFKFKRGKRKEEEAWRTYVKAEPILNKQRNKSTLPTGSINKNKQNIK